MKSATEYIKQAVKVYFQKDSFIFFAKVMAILTIISTVLSMLAGYLYPVNVYENFDFSNVFYTGGFVLLSLVMMIFGIYTRSTTLISVVNVNTEVRSIFSTGYKKAWKYLLATSIVAVIVFGGAILLIIPGIIFAVWYGFTLFLVIDQNLSIKEALKRSKGLIKGRFWKVLSRFFVFIIFGVVLTLILGYIPYLGSVLISFIAPLFLLPQYLLYKDLVLQNQ